MFNKGSFKKGHKPHNYIGATKVCKNCGEMFAVKGARRRKQAKFCSKDCHNDSMRGKPPWNKGKPAPWASGKNNIHWKGGITPKHEKIRKSLKYKRWRKQVFERDNYTCQKCGKRGVYLHADHIKPFSLYPDARLDTDNGRALCKSCHMEYGWNNFRENNPRQGQ